MKRILVVLGTRPEAIKLAPVIHALRSRSGDFETRVCLTAQHRELVDRMLDFFGIVPDVDLDLMRAQQAPGELAARVLTGMQGVLTDWGPDWVVVQGDTTTAMAAAMAAFYQGIRVAHVEAGLRTHDLLNPFPEEMNRQVIARLATLHFAPTVGARENLMAEGIHPATIRVTGNSGIDALKMALARLDGCRDAELEQMRALTADKKYILVTCHRRENFGAGVAALTGALKALVAEHNVEVIFPVHPNPAVSEPVYRELSGIPGLHLTGAVGYPAFLWLMKRAALILTDSGGIQEEAPTLQKRVVLMRKVTEREEAVSPGWVTLTPVESGAITSACLKILGEAPEKGSAGDGTNPFGDGKAAQRIVEGLLEYPERD